jgi:hypothetical protein
VISDGREKSRQKRKSPVQRADRSGEQLSIDDKWPKGAVPGVIALLETAFVPERIDNTQIYEALVAGPRALDWWWRSVLLGVVQD